MQADTGILTGYLLHDVIGLYFLDLSLFKDKHTSLLRIRLATGGFPPLIGRILRKRGEGEDFRMYFDYSNTM